MSAQTISVLCAHCGTELDPESMSSKEYKLLAELQAQGITVICVECEAEMMVSNQ